MGTGMKKRGLERLEYLNLIRINIGCKITVGMLLRVKILRTMGIEMTQSINIKEGS